MTDPLQTLRPHLRPGERVLWNGRPAAAPLARSYRKYSWVGLHLFMIPFFILFMMYDTIGSPEDILQLPARYLIISAIGAVLMIWPRWKARRVSGMAYAVTDSRIVIAEGNNARSFGPERLSVILRRDRDNGRGDLTFGEQADQTLAHPRSRFTSEYDHELSHKAGFFGIEDTKGAEAAAFKLKNGEL